MGADSAGMGSLRAEWFGTGQAGVTPCLGRGTWSCTEAACGERISSVSPSLASAMSRFLCLETIAKLPCCCEALLTACRHCPDGLVVGHGASSCLRGWWGRTGLVGPQGPPLCPSCCRPRTISSTPMSMWSMSGGWAKMTYMRVMKTWMKR